MISPTTIDAAVFVRCSCPILVLLRWDVEMPNLDLAVVVVVGDSANHAKSDDATYRLVDDLDDAMTCLVDVAALFLYDVVVVLVPL